MPHIFFFLDSAFILTGCTGCAVLPLPPCWSTSSPSSRPASVTAARAQRRLSGWRANRPLDWYQHPSGSRRERHFGNDVICIFYGKGAEVRALFRRCDYDTSMLHTQSAWFAMVILQANPELAEGLFWEIPFWKKKPHTLTHELDTFLWIFIKLEHKGECLAKEWGEMAQ